jgi:hypothetical protein
MSVETDRTDSVRSDLAFMRALVSDGGLLPAGFGEAYLAGGLIYGFQVLAQSLATGSLALAPGWSAVLGIGPSVVFMAVLGAIFWRYRNARGAGGATARAVGATFGSVGVANFALICVIGSVALRRHSLEIWLIYPCVVFVLQGAAWLVAAGMRRRVWQGLVGLGWFAAAIAMAQSLESMHWFALIAGASLIGLMAVPGAVIMHLSRKSA